MLKPAISPFLSFTVRPVLGFCVILTLFLFSVGVRADEGKPETGATASLPSIADVKPVHPRVFMTQAQCAETAALLKTDPTLQTLYAEVEKEAEKYLQDSRTIQHVLVGPRLLSQSRACLRKVLALGTVYRLSGDAAKRTACRERAMQEVRAAAEFPDWNPSHFLDTAEMTAALAIAFDWFYADLTPEEKAMVVDAIYEKGIVPGLRAHGWKKSAFNWNQVCSGGLTMGVLAVADEVTDPEKRKNLESTLQDGIRNVAAAMKSFAPDGAWAEGPAYWCYTTLYSLFYVEALEGSLGSDFGLCDFEGFDRTGNSQMAVSSPNGLSFNFADAGAGNVANSQLMWFANRFGHPEWSAFYLQFRQKPYPTAVWYYRPVTVDLTNAPLDFTFRGAEIATFRSSWTDRNAWFVGFKAGGNRVNHSHLELGNFILDHDSIRWAVDLGADNYNLPQYFGKLRWTYYRLSTRGQNTLCVDDQNQNPNAVSRILDFRSTPESGSAWTDLSDAYVGQLAYARRRVCLDRANSQVLLTDEIGPGTEETRGKSIVWQFHTQAKIEIAEDGRSAVLTQNAGKEEKRLRVTLLKATAADAHFEVCETTQGPDENPNRGIQRLVIRIPVTDAEQVLQVRFD